MTGIEAHTAASYKKGSPVCFCSANMADRLSAIIFLLALTTALPCKSAVETMSNAATESSITSTMTLILGSSNRSFLSVVNKLAGAFLFLSTFLIHTFSMLAFNEGVCCNTLYKPSPTTPKPNKPIFKTF